MSELSNANKTFLNSQVRRGGVAGAKKKTFRHKPGLLVVQEVLKEGNVTFFKNRVLSDDMEAQMWMTFMTSKAPQLDERGHMVINPATNLPYLVDVELNPICLKAFLSAVAYKRGTPITTAEKPGDDNRKVEVTWNVLGASPSFFEEAAKTMGITKIIDNPKV